MAAAVPDLRRMMQGLSQYDSIFAAVPFEPAVPDGDYRVVIEELEVVPSRADGTPMLVWTFRIAHGEFAGKSLRKYRPVTPRSIPWIKEDLIRCGLHLPKFSDLPRRRSELVGSLARVSKRTRENGTNILILWNVPDREDVPF